MPHLADEHGVAEVEVGRGGIEADLDGQGPAERELGAEPFGGDDVDAALRRVVEALRRRVTRSPRPGAGPRAHTAGQQQANGLRVDPVLGLEDARGERLRACRPPGRAPPPAARSARCRAPRRRGGRWPRSPSRRAPRPGAARPAREGGQERGMDVQDPARKRAQQDRREQPHVARQADESTPCAAGCSTSSPSKILAGAAAVVAGRRGRHSRRAGALEPRRPATFENTTATGRAQLARRRASRAPAGSSRGR